MISYIITSISSGYIPYVNIRNSKNQNIWELFFEQPINLLPTTNNMLENDSNYIEILPQWNDIYDKKAIQLWGRIYCSRQTILTTMSQEENANISQKEKATIIIKQKFLKYVLNQ